MDSISQKSILQYNILLVEERKTINSLDRYCTTLKKEVKLGYKNVSTHEIFPKAMYFYLRGEVIAVQIVCVILMLRFWDLFAKFIIFFFTVIKSNEKHSPNAYLSVCFKLCFEGMVRSKMG